jgi:hypothetical protein
MDARIERGGVQLLTRTGLNWIDKYAPIAEAPLSAAIEGQGTGTRASAVDVQVGSLLDGPTTSELGVPGSSCGFTIPTTQSFLKIRARAGMPARVRSGLTAGGKWIRTLGPAKVTCLKRGLYITGSSSTSTPALPPAERGAARFGGGDGSERRIRDAAACLAG